MIRSVSSCSASIRARVRGWTGNTTGSSRATLRQLAHGLGQQRAVDQRRAVQGHQQVALLMRARATRRCSPDRPVEASPPACRSSCCRPERSTPPALPSSSRLVRASGEWMNSRSATESVDEPVDLLRHRAVEAAQSRLDVADGVPELAGHERRRHRRVDVARNQHDDRAPARSEAARDAPSRGRSGRRGCPSRPRAGDRESRRRAARRRSATSSRRSAGRCGRARGRTRRAGTAPPRSARSSCSSGACRQPRRSFA